VPSAIHSCQERKDGKYMRNKQPRLELKLQAAIGNNAE
jgi:hypothetical protein